MWQTNFRQIITTKSLCEVLYDVVTPVTDVRYFPNKYSWVTCQIITNQIADFFLCQQVPRNNTKYFEVFHAHEFVYCGLLTYGNITLNMEAENAL
jgi:hypothetical protein